MAVTERNKNEEFFDLQPGKAITKNYKIIEYLGCGWEGEVYKVEERDTGIIRVAKLFYQNKYHEKARHINYARKLHKLRTCPIIIQYHHKDSAFINDRNVYFLVSDYTDGEVLSQFITEQKQKRLTFFEALHVFYALVQGIEHIHFIGEYHGDIHSDNIIIIRKGLTFAVHLIDLLHLGRSNKDKIQEDVYDLIQILYEMIGGDKAYKNTHPIVKAIIRGRKKSLISSDFKTAGQLRLHLDNLMW